MAVHGMDVKLHQQFFVALFPHVVDRQIDQEVVVGSSHLQEALTPFYILHQEGGVTPDAVGRTHVNGGIELPSWPRVVLGRVCRAVEEDVVDTSGKHQVEVWLHLRQRGAEVLRQPGKGLAGGERLTHDMGCRGGIFQHRQVAEILTRHTGISAQPLDAKLRQSETFNLRNVHSTIKVQQVGRRTVSLVTNLNTVTVCPADPLQSKMLVEQVGKGLAIVAEHLVTIVLEA